MNEFRVGVVALAITGLVGCGTSVTSDTQSSTSVQGISVDDILNISSTDTNKTEESNTSTTQGTEGTSTADVAQINITSDTIDEGDAFKTKNVGYTLKSSSLPVCYNAVEVKLDYGQAKTYTCSWLCGIYEGDGPLAVTLTFTKISKWELTGENVVTASSRCK